jgi:hypothetical protein
MQSVFISHAHEDSDFVNRLADDLQSSQVPATFDKWTLQVGDSIFEKLFLAVSASDKIIVVLSPASVVSQWVNAELGLAMAGRLQGQNISVLPVLFRDCPVPSNLSHIEFADFRLSYYSGLRQLLQALCPELFHRVCPLICAKEQHEADRIEIEELLSLGDLGAIRAWFGNHAYALAALFGELWAVSEAIRDFAFEREHVDFIVINGQSFRYQLWLITLGPPSLTTGGSVLLRNEVRKLDRTLKVYRAHGSRFRRTVAVRLSDSYGASQLCRPCDDEHPRESRLSIGAKLLYGRRHEFGADENRFRNEVYESSNGAFEIVSYDRLIDVFNKI